MAKTRIFNRQNLRSPTIFFGIGEEQPYYIEKVPSLITARVTHNISFFYLNYVAVTVILFALTLLISPSAIIGIGLLGFAWLGLIRATAEGSIIVKGMFIYICFVWGERGGVNNPSLSFLRNGSNTHTFFVVVSFYPYTGITITQKQATIAMSGVSVLVLIWLLNHIFWMTIGTSGFLCGVHCLLRDASMHKDESDRVIMQGDLSLDDEDGMGMNNEARFLNE